MLYSYIRPVSWLWSEDWSRVGAHTSSTGGLGRWEEKVFGPRVGGASRAGQLIGLTSWQQLHLATVSSSQWLLLHQVKLSAHQETHRWFRQCNQLTSEGKPENIIAIIMIQIRLLVNHFSTNRRTELVDGHVSYEHPTSRLSHSNHIKRL